MTNKTNFDVLKEKMTVVDMADAIYDRNYSPTLCPHCVCPCGKFCQANDSFECLEVITKWLNAKTDILDEIEKEYLKNVLAPWLKRKNEISIIKNKYQYSDVFWLQIVIRENKRTDAITFPDFCSKKVYADMESGKSYTVEELGLR